MILAFILVAILGFLTSQVLWSKPPTTTVKVDTTKQVVTQQVIEANNQQINNQQVITQVIVNDVRGKKALFIGDSHTANHGYGWQVQLCKATGLI